MKCHTERLKKVPALLFLIVLFSGIVFVFEGPTIAHASRGSLQDSSFDSPSLSQAMPYRIYLPPEYSDAEVQDAGFPVLYLLHGHEEEENYLGHTHWTERTEIAAIADSYGMIIVFPEGLRSWYSNYHDSEPGTNRFEDYIAYDLIDHIDRTYRTRRDRESRAIMGNSMGGHGAMKLAAQHPDRFCAAASMSGILDLSIVGVASLLESILPNNLGVVFGPYPANLVCYEGNSAAVLASNFRDPEAEGGSHMRLHFDAGIFDHYLAQIWAIGYARVLDDLGLDYDAEIHRGDPESAGHNWTYWGIHIEEVLDFVSAAFESPPAHPRQWRYRTIESSFEVWGWSVRVMRPLRWTWIEMLDVDAYGFDLRDDGTTSDLFVETPPHYTPGTSFEIKVLDSLGVTQASTHSTADAEGALPFTVDLSSVQVGRSVDEDEVDEQHATLVNPEGNPLRMLRVRILEEAIPQNGASSCGGCSYAFDTQSMQGAPNVSQLTADVAVFLIPVGWLFFLSRRYRRVKGPLYLE